VRVSGAMTLHGETISSTGVRAAVTSGNLGRAALMLGRPFSVLGSVRCGRRIGRELGFPTANVDPHNEVLPPRGVYAVRVLLDRGSHPGRASQVMLDGVANLGLRPTFREPRPAALQLELHILDYRGNLYGAEVEVFFLRKLRDEQRFASPAALSRGIGHDVAMARAVLAEKNNSKKTFTAPKASVIVPPEIKRGKKRKEEVKGQGKRV
jgi:riboflavin kinase / FMN adenylyltransferase